MVACGRLLYSRSVLQPASLRRGFLGAWLDAAALRRSPAVHLFLLSRDVVLFRRAAVVLPRASHKHFAVHLHCSAVNVFCFVEWWSRMARNVLSPAGFETRPGVISSTSSVRLRIFRQFGGHGRPAFLPASSASLLRMC